MNNTCKVIITFFILITIFSYYLFVASKRISVTDVKIWNNILSSKKYLNTNKFSISRNIIQTVPDKTDISTVIKKNMIMLKKNNPTWKYSLYDDKEILSFIETNYPKLLSSYLKINPDYGPARADFFRYLIIFHFGGVYLDSKSGTTKPLDDIILPTDTFVYQLTGNIMHPADINYFDGKEIEQWYIASSSGNPIIKNVITTMVNNINNPKFLDYSGKLGVLRLTGPIMFTNSIAPLLSRYPNRRVIQGDDFIYNNVGYFSFNYKSYSSKSHYSTLTIPILYNNDPDGIIHSS